MHQTSVDQLIFYIPTASAGIASQLSDIFERKAQQFFVIGFAGAIALILQGARVKGGNCSPLGFGGAGNGFLMRGI